MRHIVSAVTVVGSDEPEPAVVTAPRAMVGRHIGGVATEFVQGC